MLAWSGMKVFTPCRTVESLTCVRSQTNGEVTRALPMSQATDQERDAADAGAADRVDAARGVPGHAVAQRRADRGGQQLPERRRQERDHDGEQCLLGRAVHDRLDDRRRDEHADNDAADEAHEAQRTDDEALPVSRDREEHDERQKDQVEEVIAQHWFTV